jgi:hypothetical protein
MSDADRVTIMFTRKITIMKKVLMLSCAAGTMLGCSGAAFADSTPGKFDVILHGDAWFTAGYVNQNSYSDPFAPGGATGGAVQSQKSVTFADRFHLTVMADANADNGLEYGALLSIRAAYGGYPDPVDGSVSGRRSGVIDSDQAYVFANGNFGEIQGGVLPGVNNEMHTGAPNNFGTGGVDGDWNMTPGPSWIMNQSTFLEPYFGGGFTTVTYNQYGQKINYFTPRIFQQNGDHHTGLQAIFSYGPNDNQFGTGVQRSTIAELSSAEGPYIQNCATSATPLTCDYQDIWETGLRYDGAVSDVQITANFGTIAATTRNTVGGVNDPTKYHDLFAYQAGLQLAYGAWQLGGSYANAGKSAYTENAVSQSLFFGSAHSGPTHLSDQYTWDIGLSYQVNDPLVIGANYQYGHDSGDPSFPGADLYAVGATYVLAPGLTTSLEYLKSVTNNQSAVTSFAAATGSTAMLNAVSGNADIILWKNSVTF